MKELLLIILLVMNVYSFAQPNEHKVSDLKNELSNLKNEISALRAKLECVTAIVFNMNNERLETILNTDKKQTKYMKKFSKIKRPLKPDFKNDKNRKAWLNFCEKRIKLDFSEVKKWK